MHIGNRSQTIRADGIRMRVVQTNQAHDSPLGRFAGIGRHFQASRSVLAFVHRIAESVIRINTVQHAADRITPHRILQRQPVLVTHRHFRHRVFSNLDPEAVGLFLAIHQTVHFIAVLRVGLRFGSRLRGQSLASGTTQQFHRIGIRTLGCRLRIHGHRPGHRHFLRGSVTSEERSRGCRKARTRTNTHQIGHFVRLAVRIGRAIGMNQPVVVHRGGNR